MAGGGLPLAHLNDARPLHHPAPAIRPVPTPKGTIIMFDSYEIGLIAYGKSVV